MYNKFLTLMVLCTSFLLGACNQNSGKGNQGPKLGSHEAKIIMQSLSSLGQLSNSKRQSKHLLNVKHDDQVRNQLMMQELFKAMASAQTEEPQFEESAQQKAARLSRMINENNCQFNYPTQEGQLEVIGQSTQMSRMGHPSGSNRFTIPTFKIEVTGPECPIHLSMEMNGEASDSNVTAKFDWKFKVVSSEFSKETDISDLQLHGDIKIDSNISNSNNISMSMNFNFNGSGTSQSQGSFNLASQITAHIDMVQTQSSDPNQPSMPNMKISGQESTSLTAGGKSLNFSSKILTDGNNSTNVEYFIDGNKVSQSEYFKTVGEFKIPGLENMGGDQTQIENGGPSRTDDNYPPPSEIQYPTKPIDDPISKNPNTNLDIKCETTFYEPLEFSLVDLKRYAELGFNSPSNDTTTLASTTTQGQTDLYGKATAVVRYQINTPKADVSIIVRNKNGFIATSPQFIFDANKDGSNKGEAYSIGDFNAYIFCQSI